MIEQHYKMSDAARLAGVSRDTLVRWLEDADIAFNRGARGRGKAALIPESVLLRIIQRRSIRPAAYHPKMEK